MKGIFRRTLALALLVSMVLPTLVSADSGPRFYGANRYETNVAVVEEIYSKSDMVVLASGKKFPDALSAFNFGNAGVCPIVLMDDVTDATYPMLKRLEVKRIIMVGGPNTLSPDFERKLKQNFEVNRVYGANRYETSQKAYDMTKEFYNAPPTPVVTTGEYFQEPLIATAYASYINQPLLLKEGMARYTMTSPKDGTVKGSSIGDFNNKVLKLTEGNNLVLAQVDSFPDTLSAVNFSYFVGYKIKLVSSVKASDSYKLLVGGPNTLKLEGQGGGSKPNDKPANQPGQKPVETPTQKPPETQTEKPDLPYDEAAYNRAFLKLVNAERKSQGLNPVAIADYMAPAVRTRVEEERHEDQFDHKRPNGVHWSVLVKDILKSKGLEYGGAGEIIASNFHNNDSDAQAKAAFTSWKNSPGHYKIMMGPDYQYMYLSKGTITKGQYKGQDLSLAIFFAVRNQGPAQSPTETPSQTQTQAPTPSPAQAPEEAYDVNRTSLTQKEKELGQLINDYRASKGLKRLPISKSLTKVARYHVIDIIKWYDFDNPPKDSRGEKGNLHTWSYNRPELYSGVVYTPDHKYAEGMWNKPKELTSYTGDGFEISAAILSKNSNLTASRALEIWQASPGHNAVIVGEGSWADLNVMGIGIHGCYACVWFGKVEDPAGYY